MGAKQSISKTPSKNEVKYIEPEGTMEEFDLVKHHPGCTGMFWRSDPTGQTSLASNSDWPRDGAKLRGRVVEVDGKKWLLASDVMQNESKYWIAAPKGAAMPFEYNNHYSLKSRTSGGSKA